MDFVTVPPYSRLIDTTYRTSFLPAQVKKTETIGLRGDVFREGIAATLVLTAMIVGVAVWKLKPSDPQQVARSVYSLPEGQQLNNVFNQTLAVSPDGRQFVYVTDKGLYLRSLDEFDAKLIIGTETNPACPFFSPDGKWIGYYSGTDRKLKKISFGGGAPVALCDIASIFMGASWRADDKIVYSEFLQGVMRVSANGGTPELIGKGNILDLQSLPDGKSLLFTFGSAAPYKIIVQSLQSSERRELFAGDNARYISTGHIVYGLGNNLFAVPFDLKTLKVAGEPVSVVEGIWRADLQRTLQYAVTDAGALVYVPGSTSAVAARQRTLVWVDWMGKEAPIAAPPNDYFFPRLSPDGTKVALTITSRQKGDIWIWDFARETMTRLTFNEASRAPLWTPDGKRIVFASAIDNTAAICSKAADGTGEDDKLGSVPELGTADPFSWSGDGKTIVTWDFMNDGFPGIGTVSTEGGFKWRPLLVNKNGGQMFPQVSRDGRWMAYHSSESGRGEVYVRTFPEINKGRWQISTAGGGSPLWSPDGRKLFYRTGDAVMAVEVETEPAFKAGKPEILFRGRYSQFGTLGGHA